MEAKLTTTWKNFLLAALGCLMFAVGVNFFITPHGLYNGGIVGISQLVRDFFVNVLKIKYLANYDMAGILYFVLNIPLLYIAYKFLGKAFFYRTLIMTVIFTLVMSLVPIPETMILQDKLTSILVGGMLTGAGMGLVLVGGYCAGGQDILGLYYTKTRANLSVGKIGLLINAFVFGIMAIIYNFEIVVYSLIFTAIQNLTVDKMHAQNINVSLMIFTKKRGVANAIMESIGRGVTSWDGEGSYTREDTRIHYTVVNKYELNQVIRNIKEVDDKAFIIVEEGNYIVGNFEKRL